MRTEKYRKILFIIATIALIVVLICAFTACDKDKGQKVKTYKITIHQNNGQADIVWDINNDLPKIERNGYFIAGYYLDTEFKTEVSLATFKLTGISNDLNVYVKWEKNCEHVLVTDHEKKPTCTEIGLTAGEHCSICKKVTVEQREIPSLGHDIKTVAKKDPTCTDVGWDDYEYCTRCDYTTYSEKKAKGHSFETKLTNDGKYHWYASTCGHDVVKHKHEHVYNADRDCVDCGYHDDSLWNSEVRFKTLTAASTGFVGKIANAQQTFDFKNEIEVAENATFAIYKDIECSVRINSKIVSVAEGNNIYFVLVENGNDSALYIVTIRRRPMYTVSFEETGDTRIEDLQVEEDSHITAPRVAKRGYAVSGWNYDFDTAVTRDLVIRPTFAPIDYDITYDMNDKDSVSSAQNSPFNPQTYNIEDTVVFAAPVRKGYIFSGWSVPSISKGSIGDVTVTANWEAISYAITYDFAIAQDSASQNVDNAQNPATFTIEDSISFVSPTRRGYKFVKWDKASIAKGTAQSQTVRAEWETEEYAIEYDFAIAQDSASKNVDNAQNPATFTIEDSINFVSPTRRGYKFVGWDKASIAKGTAQSQTVRAEWEIEEYAIEYNLNIAADSISRSVDNSANAVKYTVEDEIVFSAVERRGYDFNGWSIPSIGKGSIGDVTVTANWEAISYEITYDFAIEQNSASKTVDNAQNPATFTIEDSINFVSPTRRGYKFVGWDKASIAKGTAQSQTVQAEWKTEEYAIEYDFAIAQDSASQNVDNAQNPTTFTIEDSISFASPTRRGYKFVGWDKTSIAKGTAQSQTVHAEWETEEYAIEYDLNIAADSISRSVDNSANAVKYTVEDEIVFSAVERRGYDFNGWSIPSISKGSIGDVTVTANWEAISYAITYDFAIAQDSASKNVDNTQNPATFTIEDSISFVSPTRRGYKFVSWDKASIAKGTAQSQTVRAEWKTEEYAIEYDLNIAADSISRSVDNSANAVKYTVEDEIVFSAVERRGYDFNGWSIPSISKGSVGNVTVTANWDVINYTIKYILNGGSNSVENPKTYNVDSGRIVLNDATSDILFCGWYLNDADGAYKTEIVPTLSSLGNYTLFALFDGTIGLDIKDGVVVNYAAHTVDVEIPSKYRGYAVHTIGIEAFGGNTEITSIDIPNSVTNIKMNAFYSCKSLISLSIPASVSVIESGIIMDCTALESIEVEVGNEHYASKEECLIETATKTLIAACKNSIVPSDGSVEIIGAYVFYGYDITSLTVPQCIKRIESAAFGECHISELVLFDGLVYIGDYAFAYCDMETVIIPDTVTYIGMGAFVECPNLRSVKIGCGAEKINEMAFDGCDNLVSVEFAESQEWYRTSDPQAFENAENGILTDFSDPSANATLFIGEYDSGVYFYKKKI